jgi:hypothetical protein
MKEGRRKEGRRKEEGRKERGRKEGGRRKLHGGKSPLLLWAPQCSQDSLFLSVSSVNTNICCSCTCSKWVIKEPEMLARGS